jgi:hypothetical protein
VALGPVRHLWVQSLPLLRPCGDGALREIWSAGASQLVALLLRDIQLWLPQWGYWGPPIHNNWTL